MPIGNKVLAIGSNIVGSSGQKIYTSNVNIGPYTTSSGATTYTISDSHLTASSVVNIYFDDASKGVLANVTLGKTLSAGALTLTFSPAIASDVVINVVEIIIPGGTESSGGGTGTVLLDVDNLSVDIDEMYNTNVSYDTTQENYKYLTVFLKIENTENPSEFYIGSAMIPLAQDMNMTYPVMIIPPTDDGEGELISLFAMLIGSSGMPMMFMFGKVGTFENAVLTTVRIIGYN